MTFYSEIFDYFFNKISDYDLLKNFEEKDILKLCNMYLKSSISFFTKCKKDLRKRNDSEQMFLIELDQLEIEILANLMVIEWLKPYVNNRLNLSSILGDKDFKIFSQANHLKTLSDLQDKLQNEIERLYMQYTWNDYDLSKLAKKS